MNTDNMDDRDNTESRYAFRRMVEIGLASLSVIAFVELVSFGAFSGGMWGGIGIGYAILFYLVTAWLDRSWPKPSIHFLFLALVSLVIIALLNLHSPNPAVSWFYWRKLVSIFLPLVLLTSPEIARRADHKYFFTSVILAAFVGAFALGVELFLDAPVLHISKGIYAPVTQYNRGLSYLVVLALPMMAALWTRPIASKQINFDPEEPSRQIALPIDDPSQPKFRLWYLKQIYRRLAPDRYIPLILFMLVMLLPTSLSESRAAKVAFIAGILTTALAKLAPNLTRRLLGLLVIVLLGWPYYAQKGYLYFQDQLLRLPPSWLARVEIWDYTSYRVFEHPWLGWGLGTSKFLDFKNPHGRLYQLVREVAAPHPHNVVTQLWVELGIPGLALGVLFAFLTLRQASRISPVLAPFAMGAWAAALCLTMVAYDFWTDSMFSAFALTAFAFALLEYKLIPKQG